MRHARHSTKVFGEQSPSAAVAAITTAIYQQRLGISSMCRVTFNVTTCLFHEVSAYHDPPLPTFSDI